MKLPLKIIYAVQAVVYLARQSVRSKPTRIGSIALTHRIPEKYLLLILLRLKSAGIVRSARGASGGYYLGRDPSEITLRDIVWSVDKSVLKEDGFVKQREDSTRMALYNVWNEINQKSEERLNEVTISMMVELADRQRGTIYNI